MIEKINTRFPKALNKTILNILYNDNNWKFAVDLNLNTDTTKNDGGFTLCTYLDNAPYKDNLRLNCYAEVIFGLIKEQAPINLKKIKRIFWNWYHSNSSTQIHKDSQENNHYSIIYNIFDNDGGTEFFINDKRHFFKSVESQAILFPSNIDHRGVQPNKHKNIFCLSMVAEI